MSGLKLGLNLSRNKWQNKVQTGHKKVLNCKQHAATGIYEVETDDKDHLKVIADARLKLERDIAPVTPCIVKEASRWEPQA